MIGEDIVNRVRDCKVLGIKVDEFFVWGKYVDEIVKNVLFLIGVIKKFIDFFGYEIFIYV